MERIVQTWMASGRTEEIEEAATAISQDQASMIVVVKALGEYLTSDEDGLRKKGVEFLSLVLSRIPPGTLNRQSLRVLNGFFCSKLDDPEAIKPALGGLLTLVSLPSFSPADAIAVVEGLFQHIRMKALVQSTRFIVFSIIDSLMANHRNALKSMGKTFLDGYIILAEGEKDPRNLMLAFAIARVILIEFDISPHIEALFDITYCYFPITFRPPPNDPYGITTDDLKLALSTCLNATPLFGPLGIPVFMDKLTAGSRTTKKDTLQAMAACIPVYGSAIARAHARKLWNSLKLEIFQPIDPQIEEEALRTTQILVKTIYKDEGAALENNDHIQGLARDACLECIDILKEPEKSQAKHATKILCAFISTTPSVGRYTISQAIPHLVRLFLNPDEVANRPATLALLSDFISATKESLSKSQDSSPSPIFPYKDEILGVFSVGLKSAVTRHPAVSGLKEMVLSKTLLSNEELGFIVHNTSEIIEGNQEEYADASDEILSLLSAISDISSQHVADQILPLLFRSLPDTAPAREDTQGRSKVWQTLAALQVLCIQSELFENLVIRITTKLDFISFPTVQPDDSEALAAYAHALLDTLSKTLSAKVERKHPDVIKYIDRLVPRIYNLFIYSAFLAGSQPTVVLDSRLVTVAGDIITLVVRALPEPKQRTFAISLSKALAVGDVTDIAQGLHKLDADQRLLTFDETSTTSERQILHLLGSAVVALRAEVQLSLGDTSSFLELLLRWHLDVADQDLQRTAALHILSATVNRRVDELSAFLQEKLDGYWYRQVANPELPSERRSRAINSWIWLSKALVVRKHPLAMQFAERLYAAFGDIPISWDAANALGEIPHPDKILTKANHAEVKVLFVQKYANIVLPRIMKSANDAEDTVERTASLVAITSLIKALPKAVYMHKMPSLIPLLLRGLELPDPSIRSNVIETLLSTAEGDTPEKSPVTEHATSLVQSMLKGSKVTETPTTKVRILALKYLTVLPTIVRYDVLHPHRATVLRELAIALDDPKRAVRKEAVSARTNWFKYKG